MDPNDLLNPANPLSPLCPLNPIHPLHNDLFHSTTQPARNENPVNPVNLGISMEINWLTWVLVIAALILAGIALWPVFKRVKRVFFKPKKPPCQSCQQFISCAMAGVTRCPLLK